MGYVFDAVLRDSLPAVAAEDLAARTLQGLKQIDPAFELQRADGIITVLYRGQAVSYVMATNSASWSDALSVGLDYAIAASPTATAAPPVDVAAALVNAMVTPFGSRAGYVSQAEIRPVPPLKPGTAFGATWERKTDRLLIRGVDPEGSAARVKIEPGDAIIEIDDRPVTALSDAAVADLLARPIARRITMQLARANPKLGPRVVLYGAGPRFDVSAHDGIVVIRFQAFGPEIQRVVAVYREVAAGMPPPGPTGIVLDLRSNTGGTLDAAIDLASQFLESGPVAVVAGASISSIQKLAARVPRGTPLSLRTLPLVVVVNSETASGAEIVAGALQMRQRAVVVGTATYGQGEIDTIIPIKRQLGAARFTTARAFLPGGTPLHEYGVVPAVCLAGLSGGDPGSAIAAGLRTMAAYAGRPRAKLSPEDQMAARKACPGSPREPAFDLVVAEHLARNADAYRKALESVPANPPSPGE